MQRFTRFALVLGVVSMTVSGCRTQDRVENHFDPPSLMRFSALPDTAHIVLACRFAPLPESLPDRNAVELGRAGSSILVEVSKSRLESLSKVPGLERASVWGDAALMSKLDHRLKQELLAAWDEGRQTPMPLMARFTEGTPDVGQALSREGATPRTVAGPVVTLDADPETILRIAALPGLMSLSQPTTLRPLGGSSQ